jgi:hypothetical protein
MASTITMTSTALRSAGAALAAALALAAPPAAAIEPRGLVARPLSLAAGELEVVAPLNVGASDGAAGEPISLNPSVYYGVTDALTVGLRHFVGVCLTGDDEGCRSVYDDASLDAVYALGGTDLAAGRVDVAAGAALNAGPLDPFALGGEVRLHARWAAGRFGAYVTPTLGFGITERDTLLVGDDTVRLPLAFPLYTTGGFGWTWERPGRNREWLAVPVTLAYGVTERLTLAAGIAVAGSLDDEVQSFEDSYLVPAALAASYAVKSGVDVGASFTMPAALGPNEDTDLRGFRVFTAFRF